MIIVENKLSYEVCPLCHCKDISSQGGIIVDSPTYFSSIEIELSKKPELWKCQECNSSFTHNAVCEEDAIKLYSQGSSEERWTKLPFEKSKTPLVVSKLNAFLKPGTKVLDVGCGSGTFLDFAKAKGCKTFGIEYSYKSLENISQSGHQGFSDLRQVDESFDLITAFDLIEHLYDLPSFIKSCTSKLSSGGSLILLTGDIASKVSTTCASSWWYVKYPEHIVFPSKKYFVKYSGLEIVSWISTNHAPISPSKFLFSLLKAIIKILQGKNYDGYSSFNPDHCLVILRNKYPSNSP